MGEFQHSNIYPSPWIASRDFTGLHLESLLGLPGKLITLISRETKWAGILNPDDPIVIVDTNSGKPVIYGTIEFVKKLRMKNISKQDVRQSFIARTIESDNTELSQLIEIIRQRVIVFYGENPEDYDQVSITGVRVEKVEV